MFGVLVCIFSDTEEMMTYSSLGRYYFRIGFVYIHCILNFQCNNPQTKEPKLEAAARIVPEWVDYDTEIRNLIQQIEKEKKSKKSFSKKGNLHSYLSVTSFKYFL